ncbi:LRR receptor-like serine/threonine-protein kinase EFR [Miscanthus floridulus]|uniref:LRR receptor-like serine/threonine-protein kinase EFR n=1 Tax=Miscanthus floridulus TaxID=154761 RepID=UPI0034580D53
MCCAEQPVKSNMLVALALFLLLCYGAGNIRCSTVPGNSSDMLALLDFKQAIANDPGLILSNWNTSTPYCHWAGVSCRSRTHIDRVTALELAGQSLTGTLSPSLGNLTFLGTLNLSVNHFSGHLPDLSHLHRLELLDLNSNSVQGIIPDTLTNCSNLRELVLYHNFLEGEIPLKIGLLSKLSRLRLGYNSLTGLIPPTLNNTQLRKIFLPNNQFTGSIPNELVALSNLSILSLGGNMLSGQFPTVLLNMPAGLGREQAAWDVAIQPRRCAS